MTGKKGKRIEKEGKKKKENAEKFVPKAEGNRCR